MNEEGGGAEVSMEFGDGKGNKGRVLLKRTKKNKKSQRGNYPRSCGGHKD